jgi:hypothetical protein
MARAGQPLMRCPPRRRVDGMKRLAGMEIAMVGIAATTFPSLEQRGGAGSPSAACRPADEVTAMQVNGLRNGVTSTDTASNLVPTTPVPSCRSSIAG